MADNLEFKFTIPGQLAGANELKSADRAHWSRGAKLRKTNLGWCMDHITLAKGSHHPSFSVPVAVTFAWFEPNAKRDPDNIISGQKAILDALVKCGVIQNDTQEWIKRLTHFIDIDRTNPRIEVTVYGFPPGSTTETPYRGVPGQGAHDPPGPAL